MSKLTIKFRNVGRGKSCWTSILDPPSNELIMREIRLYGELASRDVDATIDDDGIHGRIFVGGFRKVGTFTCRPPYDPVAERLVTCAP